MKRGREDSRDGQGWQKTRPSSGGARSVVPSSQHAQNSRNSLTTNDALSYLRDVKDKFQDKKETYDTFLEIMKNFKAQRIDTAGVINQVKQLFRGHKNLILGFNTFLPKGYEITGADVEDDPEPDAAPKQPVEFDQAISYVNKIKTRFASDERVYKAFLEILNLYRKGQRNISDVYEQVAMLFKQDKDLLEEFTYFLPDGNSAQPALRPAGFRGSMQPPRKQLPQRPLPGGYGGDAGRLGPNKRKVGRRSDGDLRLRESDGGDPKMIMGSMQKELAFFDKVKTRLRSREVYQEFLKCLNLFAHDIIGKGEMHTLAQEFLGHHHDLFQSFERFMQRCEASVLDPEDKQMMLGGRMGPRDGRMKATEAQRYDDKPASECDVTHWKRISQSYVELPPNYPKRIASGRTEELRDLFNDFYVAVTSGSEDYSFKHMRKNQYEEALFRVEDDHYELDLVIQQNESVIKVLQPIHAELTKPGYQEDPEHPYRLPEGTLGPVQLRAVQRIYGESGQRMVDLLLKHSSFAIPVVLTRLMQKEEEWKKALADVSGAWEKVFQENYHKSLDHRSFYFKQTDKKRLVSKALVSEIREKVEDRRKKDAHLKAVSAGHPFYKRIAADMEFAFPSKEVHDDVFKVVRFAVDHSFDKDREGADQVLRFWRTFVEPFFGLPLRSQEEVDALRSVPGDASKPAAEAAAAETATAPGSDAGVSEMEEDDVTTAGEDEDGAPSGETSAEKTEGANVESKKEALTDAEMPDTDDDDGEEEAVIRQPSEGQSEEGGDPNLACANCKPVTWTPGEANWTPGEGEPTGRVKVEATKNRLLYGNETFYIFFRYHHFLYDRLKTARECSCKKDARPFHSEVKFEDAAHMGEQDAEGLHNKFMSMLNRLMTQKLDPSTFEDKCRALLGTNSYVLFTLDKLIIKLVRQLQALESDAQAQKLADLHAYECSRATTFDDAVYAANAHVLLGDEACYRIEAIPGDDAKLTVQMMDPDKTEVLPGVMDPDFAEWFNNTLIDAPAKPNEAKIFLQRVLTPRGLDPETASLDGVFVMNGLECKLACATSKVSYVLDTEDVFVRRKKERRTAASQYGVQPDAPSMPGKKFADWLLQRRRILASEIESGAAAAAAVDAAGGHVLH